ncbi:class I SAM-dependent methyltransferase [Nocardiopsis trehalosi]|uniref:class I SAM-dependent methyltransferase n=1 Tax=Nocardiopsis trehalosi TaxID=109329 RepID=UPI00082CCED2|nr:class I SAM-dependent methyltransferase [Nocardiopsis trehalosi]
MRMPPARLWVPIAAATAAGLGLVGVLGAIGAVDGAVALQLVVSVLTAAVAAGTAVMVRRHGAQLRRLRTDLGRIGADQADLRGRVDAGVAAVAELPEAVRAVGAEQRTAFARLSDHVTERGRADYEQQVAWQELRDYLRPAPFMPALRGWAASPDVLRLLVEEIRDRAPKLVVECGSGASSVWLGYALRRSGNGRLVAIEHDERYAELSRDLVAAHGLGDIVEVRHAPLREWTPPGGGDPQPWYDTEALGDLDGIDVLFVDGPPARTAPQSRYPAGPVLLPRCSADAVVVIDDTVRGDERATSDRWVAEHPGLRYRSVPLEKGANVFTRTP